MAFARVLSELLLPPTWPKSFTQAHETAGSWGHLHLWFKPTQNHAAAKACPTCTRQIYCKAVLNQVQTHACAGLPTRCGASHLLKCTVS